MGLVVSPGAVNAQLHSMNANLSKLMEYADTLQTNILKFTENNQLQSESYDSAKEYYAEMHLPVIRGMICFAEAMISTNQQYSSLMDGYIGGAYTSEDEIKEQIAAINLMLSNITEPEFLGYAEILRSIREPLEEKLQNLYNFASACSGIYNEADSILMKVKQGIACMKAVSYHHASKTFQTTLIKQSWMKELNQLWSERGDNIYDVAVPFDADEFQQQLFSGIQNSGALSEESVYVESVTDVKTCVDLTNSYGMGLFVFLYTASISTNTMKAFKIVQYGKYWIIKGLYYTRKSENNLSKIKGTRYAVGSRAFREAGLSRYVPAGSTASEYTSKLVSNLKDYKYWENQLKNINVNNLYKFNKEDALGNIGKAVAYTAIALETGLDTVENIQNHASKNKIVADATVDVAKGLGGMAVATSCAQVGAAIGTAIPIPGVGTIVGAGIGFAAGILGTLAYNYVIDGVKIGGKMVAEWASIGLENALEEAESLGKDITEGVASGLENAKESVGNAISGMGEFVFG